MKKSLFIFFSLLTGVILLANFGFQKPEIHKPMSTFPPNDHAKEWAAIDSLEKRGLPREALERANQLYQVVRKENNPSQIIKCLIYRGKFNSELEEDGLVKAIAAMQNDLNYTTFPVKPVLQSMLAEMYARYLDNNHWKFSDRTETVDFKTDDIRTWTPGQILEKSADLYLQSVAEDRTKQVNIEDFAAILSTGNDQIVRPTLFDFLAFRALDYFMNERSYLTEPVYKFYLDNEAAFAPAAGFSKEIFASRDSSSYKLQTLRLFQKLIAFHLNDANPAALVDADLKRLQFVYDQAVIDIKDELYEKALRDLMKRHEAHEVFSNISHQLAAYYFNRGNNYQPRPFYFQNIENQEVEKNKWDFKTAFEICQTAIGKYPNSLGAGNCKNLQGQILQKNIQLYVEEVNLPEEPCLAKLEYKNLKKIFVKVIKLDEETRQKIDRIEWDERVAFFNQLQVSENWTLDLPDDGDYRMHSVELKIPALKFGQYLIMASDNAEFSEKQGGINYVFTQVSGIAFLQNNYSKTGTQYLVVNRKSGTPLKDVEAEFFKIEYNQLNKQGEPKKIGSAKSNADGKILPNIAERGSFKVKFSKGKDVLLPDNWHANYTQTATRYARINTHFFLDRAIYRPGQTIYFKGLVIEYDGDGMPSVVPKTPMTIMLRDANFQKVAELSLTTNEYGTVNGTFTTPTSGLLGAMQLTPTTTGIDGAASFRVEEYKRPKFEVTFNPVEGSYKLGEKVKVKGSAKAYAGSNIDGADVSYRVVRRVNFPFWKWWYWGGWNPWQGAEMEIGNGKIKTDENGNFEIEFEALPDRSIPAERKPEFNYVVLADVTDITGETQSGQTSVRVGYAALELDFQLPETIEAYELDSLKIGAYNLSGQDESAFVNVTITPLKAPSKIFVNRLWAMPDRVIFDKNTFEKDFPHFAFGNEDQKEAWVKESPVLSKTFPCKGATKLYVANIVWRPGVYLIAVKSKDKFGTAVELERFVTVYRKNEKLPPVPSVLWTSAEKNSHLPGETATQTFLTSEKEICVYGELENRKKTLRSGWLNLAPDRVITQTVTDDDRGGVSFKTFLVRYNRLFSDDLSYAVPWSDKELKIEYATFRDKLQPGQEEEWRIRISGTKGEKIAAEMVAAMYDASLDAFAVNSWYFNPFPGFSKWQTWTGGDFGVQSGQLVRQAWNEYFEDQYLRYTTLNWFGWEMHDFGRMYFRNKAMAMDGVMLNSAPPSPESAGKPNMADAESAESEEVDLQTKKEDTIEKKAEEKAPPVRTNLKETVFFFPNLMTDERGNILIKFKMNEALTRWKFLGFAHTKSLQYALTEKSVITQKELMVQPNPPRFFRESDEIEFTAKVSNLTSGQLTGTARLQLFDALTNEPVDALLENTNPEIPFSAKAGQSARLAWKLKIPVGKVQAIVHRVTAQAGNFSDGEESVLPVLTNRMLVTETMPLPVRGGQTKEFVFKSMKENKSTTLQNHRLTLEYTSNPAWYAVQALPYIMEYPYECTEQVFNRFYANSLATHVANSHPKIQSVFERWKQYEPQALLSNLSKNQELKTALLEETPWVLQAKNEEAQKKNIALLFDLNRMSYEMDGALQKLAERQNGNGGWSWFPGGQPNWYMSQYIVEGMGHLQRLKVRSAEQNPKYKIMLEKAVRFIDYQMLNEYEALERLVKNGKAKWEDNHLGYLQIHYLYTRSFFLPKKYDQAGGIVEWNMENRFEMDEKTEKAFRYYLGQAEKYWLENGIYQQGMLALALQRCNNSAAATQIIKSLKDRSLNNPELGMYWKYPTGWWWYQAPIETQALMVEVFEDAAKDATSVDDLKVWLLKNKQTTHWKTTKATASAVYALLMSGDNWILDDAPVQISFPAAGQNAAAFEADIKNAQKGAEAGTGYFKVNWEGSKVDAKFAAVKVQNPNKVVSWGGLYWQYFEQLDKIKTFEETPLTIKKQLFRVENSDTGEKLVLLNANAKVGEKLKVRIELRVDRDMEYVHMKDMRASGFEPINVLSQYKWQGGLGYYESTRDAATNFFFDYLPKGTYVFEYPLRVVHNGDFSNGITTIQCMYAPEFTSHSEGVRVVVK